MATERSRARRGYGNVRSEPIWRKGATENTAAARYGREQLLSLYRPSPAPQYLADVEGFAEVVLNESDAPAFAGNLEFSHSLGEEVNSRDRQVKMPDWYPVAEGETVDLSTKEPAPVQPTLPEIPPPTVSPKPVVKAPEAKPLKIVLDPKAVIRNLPKDLEVLNVKAPAAPVPDDDVFEERYSNIDVEMEKKLKVHEEEDEEIPEWAQSTPEKSYQPVPKQTAAAVFVPEQRTRKFSIQLLQSQVVKGDPFAKLILDHGTSDGQGYTHLSPYSLPLEKVWFYKDPQMQVQGPFTSIEMYSWNLMGYFSKNLQVAWKAPVEFRTLGQMADSRRLEETPVVAGLFEKFANEGASQRPVNAKTVNEIEKSSSTKWGNSYNEHFPAFSNPTDADPSAALKSMLGIKPDAKVTAWGVAPSKPSAKSLVEIQREQREALSRKR